jgi:hypothetical protein
MLKKVFGLASVLLLLIFLGAACAPTASQKDLQDLQFQVQSLSKALESTQDSLSATQEALISVQSQNQQLQNQLAEVTAKCSACDNMAQTCIGNNLATQSGFVLLSSSYYPYNYSYQLPCQYSSPCTPLWYSPSSWRYAYHHVKCLYHTYRGHWRDHWRVPPCPEPYPPPCPEPCPSPCPEPHPSPCPDLHPSPCPCPPHFRDFSSPTAVEATIDTVATEPMVASAITTTDSPATALPETTTEPAPSTLQTVEAVNEPAPDCVATVTPSPEIATEPALSESISAAVTDSVIPGVESVVAPDAALDATLAPTAVPDQVLETMPAAPAAIEAPIITEFTTETAPSTSQTVEVINEPVPDFVATAAPSPEIVIEPALPELTSASVTEPMPVVRPVPPITEPPAISEVTAVPEPSILEIKVEESIGETTL